MKTSNKILTVAVILLLFVNVAMLVFMLKGRGHRPDERGGKGNPGEMMAKELNMTDQQKADFKKLKEGHFAAIAPLFDSIKMLKKSMFEMMKKQDMSDSSISKYSSLIAEQQALIDKATVKHFRTVRAMFSGDQQKKYDDFVEKMMQRRMSRPGRGDSDSADKK